MAKKKKIRVELRKNRAKPPRENTWTQNFRDHGFEDEATVGDERVRAKGDLSRHRTIILSENNPTDSAGDADGPVPVMPSVDETSSQPGRVIRVHGLYSIVETDDGRQFRCAVRRLLKSLVTDERNIVTCGDRVWFRASGRDEGWIERIEPRRGVLTRESRRREHVLVANVDQVVIVLSLVEPDLKPHLIDRYLATALRGQLRPVIALNKADLIDPVAVLPMIGAYAQLGIPAHPTSAKTGLGIDLLRRELVGRSTVFSGQSGVGKSSLLNAIQPELGLQVKSVSAVNQKGRHTTTASQLIRLNFGGWVVDTPGVRQLQLWATRPEEVEGYFPEFRPFVPLCKFADCNHVREEGCAVLRAVRRRWISERRYTSYLGMFQGMAE